MKYYPYGGERSVTGDMITDKLFTGQQKEADVGSSLGLYNYGARFYSTLMGRFVSPDPVIANSGDPQTLNRYAYVRNNPLIFVDPTGLTMAVVCGMSQNCSGGSIGGFQEWVISYWMENEGISEDEALIRWENLTNEDFDTLTRDEIIKQYDVFFIDSEDLAAQDRPGDPGRTDKILGLLREMVGGARQGSLKVVLGFSQGGAYVHNMLVYMVSHGISTKWIQRVILVQSALRYRSDSSLDAEDLPWTRIITVNAPQGVVTGRVTNAINVTGTESGNRPCFGPVCAGLNHGTMSRTAPFVMHLMFVLPTTHSVEQDLKVVALLQLYRYGIENEWSLTGH